MDQAGDARPMSPALRAVLGVLILAGLAMRLACPGTTAFCEDQARACALAQDLANGNWQSAALVNSGGVRNPPGFVYLLAGAWLVRPDPLTLWYFIAATSVAAVVLAGLLMRRWIGQAAWWATAFLACAPWAIQYGRWIWAQDLLFPAALATYFFLWLWLWRRKRWAAGCVIVALAATVQIHLAGAVLALAVIAMVLWRRPPVPLVPVLIGLAVAAAMFAPYLLGGHLQAPGGQRFGYRHAWRVVPAAAMSVSGLGWQLEFRAGHAAFAESLGWRRWPYELAMTIPPLLLAGGLIASSRRLFVWRRSSEGFQAPVFLVLSLVVLIPLVFALCQIRTSPTYLPVWYPLPFAVIGLAAIRFAKPGGKQAALRSTALVAVLLMELLFFAEQTRYIRSEGGVPGSVLGRSYAALQSDVDNAVAKVKADEVWMVYEGESPIQREASAYLMRQRNFEPGPGRVLIRFRPGGCESKVEPLPQEADVPKDAFLIRPWQAQQQRGAVIPALPQAGAGPARE